MACHLRVRRLRLLQIDSNEKAGAAVRGYISFAFVGFLILQVYHCGDILELRQNGGDEDGQNNYVVSRFGEYRRGSGFW